MNLARIGLVLQKYAPQIFLYGGIGAMVFGTILAAKASMKIEVIMAEYNEKLKVIKDQKELEDNEDYSEEDYRKDMLNLHVQTVVKILKLYGPAITLCASGIAAILGAHKILSIRNAALVSAYKLIETGFSKYRQRVIDEYGRDKDFEFRHGLKKEIVQEEDEEGKKKGKPYEITTIDPNNNSMYAKFYDSSCAEWEPNPEYNLMRLNSLQNYFNDMLQVRGHVFLNEVYDSLGIPRTSAGAVVGWVMSEDGDNYIDFGIYDLGNTRARDFVNGYEAVFLLDFNVNGPIHDLI